MKKKTKQRISTRVIDHLVQAVLIFASVFLAFWLTERRDHKSKQELLKVSLEQIASEMEANHEQLERVYVYYKDVVWQIDSLKKSDVKWKQYYGYYLNGWKGMVLPLLRSTAYQTLQNSAIASEMDLELAKSLADIYIAQSIATGADNSVFHVVMTDQSFTELPTISHISNIYIEILPQIMLLYQSEGKKWLEEYGYDSGVQSEKLQLAMDKIDED